MVAIPKIRIKFGSVRASQTFRGSEKRIEHSLGEDLSRSSEQSKKRGRNEIDDVQPEKKKQKLDRDLSSQCLALLRSLMEHQHGWVFNTPVDPVELMIPDYFSVISNPMDLGTIKSKLLKNEYGNADEFAADVRLTFDNAVRYNPRGNWVYNLAKEIKEVFEVRWELLNEKKKVPKPSRIGGVTKESFKRQSTPGTSASVSVGLAEPAKENPQKGLLSSKPAALQSKKDTPKNKPSGIGGVTEGFKRQPVEVDCSRQSTPGTSASVSVGLANPAKFQSKKETPAVTPALTTATQCGSCLLKPCSSSGDGTPSLPPEKALRVAMIKAKYADTIIKAKLRKVLDQKNDKGDLLRIQIEKEQMERAQREEKARIESELRAAKVAAQMRAQAELKEQRDRQRLELANMERVVDFEQDNYLIFQKEIIKVCGCSSLTRIRLLLEDFGLVLRSDDCPDLQETGSEICLAIRIDDLEEGEIL